MLQWELACSTYDRKYSLLYDTNILRCKLILFLHGLLKNTNLEPEQLSNYSDYSDYSD